MAVIDMFWPVGSLHSTFSTTNAFYLNHSLHQKGDEFFHSILIFLFVICIGLYHTQHQVPNYHRKFSQKKTYLYLHVITGLAEALRYRLHAICQNQSEMPSDMIDVILSFIWSWTSFKLVRTLRRGHPRTTRPPYQAGACLRPIVSLLSYSFQIPCLHRLSISALDAFVYARLGIFFLTYTSYLGTSRGDTIYAISIPLSAILSIHESRVPGASLAFLFIMACITKLNQWVTQKSRQMRE